MISGTESDQGLPGADEQGMLAADGLPDSIPTSQTEAEAHEGSQSTASSVRNLGVRPLGSRDVTSVRLRHETSRGLRRHVGMILLGAEMWILLC